MLMMLVSVWIVVLGCMTEIHKNKTSCSKNIKSALARHFADSGVSLCHSAAKENCSRFRKAIIKLS